MTRAISPDGPSTPTLSEVARQAQRAESAACGVPECTFRIPRLLRFRPIGLDVYAVERPVDQDALRAHLRDAHSPAVRPALRVAS